MTNTCTLCSKRLGKHRTRTLTQRSAHRKVETFHFCVPCHAKLFKNRSLQMRFPKLFEVGFR